MKYFIARNVDCGEESLYQSNDPRVKKECYVVVNNYNDEPVTAQVVSFISRHKVLTSSYQPTDIIAYVDMKAWNEKREKELDDLILIDKMENEIKRVQLMEKLEKFAGKDPKILELWVQLNGQTSMDNLDESESKGD